MRLGIHRCATGAASFALALVCCAIPSTTVHAALLAVDNASDAVYATWDPGDNGGTGWGGGWSFRSNTNAVITSTNGNRGWFVASSTNNDNVAGDTNADGDINTAGSKAWGLYSNTANTNEIYAVRPFSGALVVGQGVRMDFDNGNINTGAVVGVRLISDAGNV